MPELADRQAEVVLAGRRFTVKKEFLDDLGKDHVEANLRKLGRALLILHSPVDQLVGVDHARRIYEGARQPKSIVEIDGADHLLRAERDARFVAEILATWAERYVRAAMFPISSQ